MQMKLDNYIQLGKHMERKIETFDDTVESIKKATIENDARTEKLESLIKNMETKLNKLESG